MVKSLLMAAATVLIANGAASAQGNNCSFPGSGWGVHGTPGDRFSGTFPGGGATGGIFPGGSCGGGPTLTASEPVTLLITAAAFVGVAWLHRRRK
jgi:hypothetical protein